MGDLRNDAQVIDCALVVARACLAAPDPPTKATAIVAARANELSVFRFVNGYDLLLERDGVFHNPHSPILLQPAVDGKLQPQNRRGDFRSRSLTSYVDKSSREHRLPTGGSPVEMTETADLKAAGHRSSPIVGSIRFKSLWSSPPLRTVQLLYSSCPCRRFFSCGAGYVVNWDVRASTGGTQGQRPSKPPPTTAFIIPPRFL
jgi:hypothetical protein